MKAIKILNKTELNSFADERFCNNGGGYFQPKYEFDYDSIQGVFEDTSCGEFGSRLEVNFNGKRFYYDGVGRDEAYCNSNFDENEDKEFLDAFWDEFGICIATRQDLEAEDEE